MSILSSLWGAIGRSEVTFENGEALDGSGLPVSLSSTLDDMTVDQFWELSESLIRNRKPNPAAYEMEYKVSDMEDGSIRTELLLASSGLAEVFVGKVSGRAYYRIYMKRDEGQMITYVYGSPELSSDSHSMTMHMTVHPDPLRLEFYQEMMAVRQHGPMLKGMLEASLKKGGYEVEVQHGVPSPTQEGKTSVLTSALPDGTTIEKLFAMHCQQAKDERGATEIPGGAGVLMEMEGLATSTFLSICMSDDGTTILHKNFGTDETMTDLQSTIHEKLVPDPLRIEVFTIQEYQRHPAKEYLADYTKALLAFAKGEEPRPA